MVMKSIFLPVTMFLLAFFTLINNTSSTLMSPPIDHQHKRHLQQGSTPAGQQINPSSPVVQVQPLTGMNAYLPADRSSAGSKSSKPIEQQNNNINSNNKYTATPIYPVPYSTSTFAKATRQQVNNQVVYGPYGAVETNMISVSSAEQNTGVGVGRGFAINSVNSVTINNNYYGAVLLPMSQPTGSVYIPPMNPFIPMQIPMQIPVQYPQQLIPNINPNLPLPLFNQPYPLITPPSSNLQPNLNPKIIQTLPQTTTIPLPTPSSLASILKPSINTTPTNLNEQISTIFGNLVGGRVGDTANNGNTTNSATNSGQSTNYDIRNISVNINNHFTGTPDANPPNSSPIPNPLPNPIANPNNNPNTNSNKRINSENTTPNINPSQTPNTNPIRTNNSINSNNSNNNNNNNIPVVTNPSSPQPPLIGTTPPSTTNPNTNPLPNTNPTVPPIQQKSAPEFIQLEYRKYIEQYNPAQTRPRQMQTIEQLIYHQSIYIQNIQKINLHNKQPNITYFMGLNKFTDMDPEQFNRKYLRLHINQADKKEAILIDFQMRQGDTNRPFTYTQPDEVTVDWGCLVGDEALYVGVCDSSYAVAALQAIRITAKIYGQDVGQLSIQEVISCGGIQNSCSYGLIDPVFRYAVSNGIGLGSMYTYDNNALSNGVASDCNQNLVQSPEYKKNKYFIKQFAKVKFLDCKEVVKQLQVRSLAVGISGALLQFYASGTYFTDDPDINHAVSLVGYYPDKGYKIKNNWGNDWGMRGYAFVTQEAGVCHYAQYPVLIEEGKRAEVGCTI